MSARLNGPLSITGATCGLRCELDTSGFRRELFRIRIWNAFRRGRLSELYFMASFVSVIDAGCILLRLLYGPILLFMTYFITHIGVSVMNYLLAFTLSARTAFIVLKVFPKWDT